LSARWSGAGGEQQADDEQTQWTGAGILQHV
jgi:hypothetical protein